MAERSDECALFVDFENLFVSAQNHLGVTRGIDWHALIRALEPHGRIGIRKAYANWGNYARHQADLMNCAILPVQAVGRNKNVADMLIVMDVMETLLNAPQIKTFIIASGDTDFTFLVQRLRAHHKQVIGIGVRRATAAWLVQVCDSYLYYDDIVAGAGSPPSLQRQLQAVTTDVWKDGASVINELRRANPAFDSEMRAAGFGRFRELLDGMGEVVETRLAPGQGHLEVRRVVAPSAPSVRAAVPPALSARPITQDDAGYIEAARRQQLVLVPDVHRPEIIFRAHELMASEKPPTLTALKERMQTLYAGNDEIDGRVVQSVIYQLFYAYIFKIERQGETKLWDCPFALAPTVTSRQEMLRLTDLDILHRIARELPGGAAALDPAVAARVLYGRDDHPAIINHVSGLKEALTSAS